jgi:hypothetical protein
MLGNVIISRNVRQYPAQIATQGTAMQASVWNTPIQRFSPKVRLSGRMYSSTANTTNTADTLTAYVRALLGI